MHASCSPHLFFFSSLISSPAVALAFFFSSSSQAQQQRISHQRQLELSFLLSDFVGTKRGYQRRSQGFYFTHSSPSFPFCCSPWVAIAFIEARRGSSELAETTSKEGKSSLFLSPLCNSSNSSSSQHSSVKISFHFLVFFL